MNVTGLEVFLGRHKAGLLIRFEVTDTEHLHKFVADPAFIKLMSKPAAPMLSISHLPASPEEAALFYADHGAPRFNGHWSSRNGWLLPSFWQNMLPEGVFRNRVAEIRGCSPTDHLEMFSACARGLPGNIYATPVTLDSHKLSTLVTQDNDALETSVFSEALPEGEALSGVQPKLAVMRDGDRFVARTRDLNRDTNIIAKLPVVGQPLLPELEELSLRLAQAAGVEICRAYLAPLSQLAAEHSYDLGDVDAQTQFLAIERFDRIKVKGKDARVHWEDFAQILGVMPEDKYTRSYAQVGRAMMAFPSLGEAAVHQLLRRLAVNELLGNVDMHLKNMGVIYPDSRTPRLADAFDIVGYSAYNKRQGHALALVDPNTAAGQAPIKKAVLKAGAPLPSKPSLTPALLREFCDQVNILEKPAAAVLRHCAMEARKTWPAMIAGSALTTQQKKKLLAHFQAHPWIVQLDQRAVKAQVGKSGP